METKQPSQKPIVEQYDSRSIYCRMLGHDLTFKYCRLTGDGHFCRRVFDCWYHKIDIGGYMKLFFSKDEIQAALQPPASKVHTLINLIEKSGGNG